MDFDKPYSKQYCSVKRVWNYVINVSYKSVLLLLYEKQRIKVAQLIVCEQGPFDFWFSFFSGTQSTYKTGDVKYIRKFVGVYLPNIAMCALNINIYISEQNGDDTLQ